MRHSFIAVALSASLAQAQSWNVGQLVKTSSGSIVGHGSSWKPQVSEYLGVPFAQPPVGNLRWAAPQHIKDASKTLNATKYVSDYNIGSCSESASRISRNNPNAPKNIGAAENEEREDCLTLNIWSKPQTGEKKKAVLIWIYGGGFVVGSAANQAYNGARLADEHDVVVVSVNYRLGVLGFPGVGLPDTNLGLLDQRVAVEWLRDNIASFGGDPSRMVLFGQSAGGMSVDFYAYAYTQDPIVHGFIPQSGNLALAARMGSGAGNASVVNWSNLSEKLGCGAVTAAKVDATLVCMRAKPVDAILDATVPKNSASAVGSWGPKPDGKTVFSGSGARAAAGNIIKAPVLVGNVDNEGATSGQQPGSLSNRISGCGSGAAADVRRKLGVPAWRYLYSGSFPNNGLGPCCTAAKGAWHGAEIALIFGTTELKNKGQDTPNEAKLSKTLRDAWTGFAKDPVNGLSKLGWPRYDPEKPTVIVLGGDDSADVKFELPSKTDGSCAALKMITG
ncbi:alpha/beta-hydrolase [Trichodelitschia bisporula]|uniref:Carboxylic ester hydrolase n=1 Tax=Trichodelitschia bisporula TaxID=703511 RepID=A0A6G1I0R0_9PEZI|nr:alpha/beta-hydrolase [Trichodelitschia bisporula]